MDLLLSWLLAIPGFLFLTFHALAQARPLQELLERVHHENVLRQQRTLS